MPQRQPAIQSPNRSMVAWFSLPPYVEGVDMRYGFLLMVVALFLAGCKSGSVELPTGSPTMAGIAASDSIVMGAQIQTGATPTAPK